MTDLQKMSEAIKLIPHFGYRGTATFYGWSLSKFMRLLNEYLSTDEVME